MKINQIFLEYNRQTTATNYGAKLIAAANKDRRYREIQQLQQADVDERYLDDILNRLESADPTKNKEYTQALANLYSKGGLKMEDVTSTLSDYLVKFHKLKNKKMIPSPRNDFMSYSNIGDFYSVVDEYPDVQGGQQDKGSAKEVYKDADLRIIKPADQTAACYYGQGTRWCTAAQNNNMFNTYAKKGELYIIIPAKPAHTGEKYQFHFETKQFMDEKDRRANLSELRQRYPQLADIFAKQAMEHNVLALRKDISDLNAMMQKALPIFRQELKSSIARESKERAREIFVELGHTNKVFKNMEEIWELTEDMFDEKGGDLALMSTNILRNDPDMASDEDQLFDALSNEITDIVRDTELWSYISELLEDLDDTESEFDAAMTIEGELNSMLQRLIPEAFAEAITQAKQGNTNEGFDMNIFEVAGVGKLHGLTVMSLDKFVDQETEEKTEEGITEAPGDFGLGANYRAVPDDEMQAFLDRSKTKNKTKRDKFDYPYVHGSNIEVKDEAGKTYDTEALKQAIMVRPKSILGQNAKMQHSETGDEAIFDIGLPALKGLAVNEKTGEFVIVDTCPGAGACQTYCYAMKGSYVMFKAVSMGLARMLNFLLNDPEGFASKLNQEIAAAKAKLAKKNAKMTVRWHDAGDFFSPEYLAMAYSVAEANPDVGFYAYTKMGDVANAARPKNFNMNFSQGAKRGQEKKVDIVRTKHSKVVPKDMFFDLIARKGNELIKDAKGRMQFASPENLEQFKADLAKRYAIDKGSILTYDQMMKIPVGDKPKWNVIVMPGDGDNSANRNDVVGSYLLFH